VTKHPTAPGPNPFVPTAGPIEQPEEIETDPILGSALTQEGLGAPRLARDVAPARIAPESPRVTSDTVWLLGASGGVGASTLAALAGETVIDGGVHTPPWQAPVFVVAATHPAGLDAAAELARANARGDITYDLRGLILVHDRPKISKASIQLARSVAGVYPRTMTVPYMPAWREPGIPEVGNNVRVRFVLAALAPKRKKQS